MVLRCVLCGNTSKLCSKDREYLPHTLFPLHSCSLSVIYHAAQLVTSNESSNGCVEHTSNGGDRGSESSNALILHRYWSDLDYFLD